VLSIRPSKSSNLCNVELLVANAFAMVCCIFELVLLFDIACCADAAVCAVRTRKRRGIIIKKNHHGMICFVLVSRHGPGPACCTNGIGATSPGIAAIVVVVV
jgi:hypothetical protein